MDIEKFKEFVSQTFKGQNIRFSKNNNTIHKKDQIAYRAIIDMPIWKVNEKIFKSCQINGVAITPTNKGIKLSLYD